MLKNATPPPILTFSHKETVSQSPLLSFRPVIVISTEGRNLGA